MPKINMDQLLEAVNGLIGEENEEGSNKEANTKEERRKAQEVAEEAERKAEAKRKAEEEEKAKEKAEKEKKDAEEKQAKQEQRVIDSKLEAGFAQSGFDKQARKVLSEFVNYGSLKNDDGEADEEKIDKFIDAVSSVALRKPPRSKGKKIDHDNMGGIGKYLEIDI